MQTKMTGAIRFPKTLQAAQRAEHDQWSLGDALLAECGAPGDDSTNNGSFRKLKAAQAELEAHGIEYAEITLRIYRDAAHNFPPDTRISGVSHRVHIECRSPAMLNAVLAAWKLEKPGQPLALHACARLLVEIRRQADEAYKAGKANEAKAAQERLAEVDKRLKVAQDAAARAGTPEAKRDAIRAEREVRREHKTVAQEHHRLSNRPKGDPLAVPAPGTMSRAVFTMDMLQNAHGASVLAEKASKLADMVEGYTLSEDNLGAIVEAAMTAANDWREVAQKLQKLTKTKASHLMVVGGSS